MAQEVINGSNLVSNNSLYNGNKVSITIINLNTKTRVTLFSLPETLSDAYEAQYNEKSIIGRSTPLVVYSGGSSRKISFNITVHEDLLMEDDIRDFCAKVAALAYPVYKDGIKPPKVYCRIGNMMSFWGVVNTSINYRGAIRKGRYIMADLSFNFIKIGSISRGANSDFYTEEGALSAIDIEGGKYVR